VCSRDRLNDRAAAAAAADRKERRGGPFSPFLTVLAGAAVDGAALEAAADASGRHHANRVVLIGLQTIQDELMSMAAALLQDFHLLCKGTRP